MEQVYKVQEAMRALSEELDKAEIRKIELQRQISAVDLRIQDLLHILQMGRNHNRLNAIELARISMLLAEARSHRDTVKNELRIMQQVCNKTLRPPLENTLKTVNTEVGNLTARRYVLRTMSVETLNSMLHFDAADIMITDKGNKAQLS